jgi:hypothetical protein
MFGNYFQIRKDMALKLAQARAQRDHWQTRALNAEANAQPRCKTTGRMLSKVQL